MKTLSAVVLSALLLSACGAEEVTLTTSSTEQQLVSAKWRIDRDANHVVAWRTTDTGELIWPQAADVWFVPEAVRFETPPPYLVAHDTSCNGGAALAPSSYCGLNFNLANNTNIGNVYLRASYNADGTLDVWSEYNLQRFNLVLELPDGNSTWVGTALLDTMQTRTQPYASGGINILQQN